MATEDGFEQDDQHAPDWLKNLRKENREMKKQLADLASVQRENAALKIGLDLNNPVSELFLEKQGIDWGDVEAVKEAAAKYGLVKAGEESAETAGGAEMTDDERLFQAMEQAQSGGGAPTPKTPDYMQAKSAEDFIAQYRAAGGLVADL